MTAILPRRCVVFGLSLLPAALLTGVAFADNGKGNSKNKGNSGNQGNQGNSGKQGDSGTQVKIDGSGLSIRFSDSEIRIIDDYYRRYPAGNVQSLPPGIAKNLARGKPLPPGIAKKYLPNDLTRLLPAVRPGTNRLVVGSDILLIEASTGLILDVLNNVLR